MTDDIHPWYDAAFGADYLDRYRHRDESEAANAVALFHRISAGRLRWELPMLDLCCGAGRHLRLLSATGAPQVFGLDRSAALLAAATAIGRPLVRGDMAMLPFRRASLGTVTSFFTSFGYFEEDAHNARVFAEVARCLTPNGLFFFDFLNATALREELAWLEECRRVRIADPRDTRRLSQDGRRVLKRLHLAGRQVEESVRLFDSTDIERMLEAAGLQPLERVGNYDGAVFDAACSPRLILLAQKR